jgi:hypothetical protein
MRAEDVDPHKCCVHVWKELGKRIREIAGTKWEKDGHIHSVSEKETFFAETMETYRVLYSELQIQNEITKKANLWTKDRDTFLTSAVQKMDEFTARKNAETCWRRTCGNPRLKFVDPEIVRRRAVEIGMLCMDEEVIERIAIRCWACISDAQRISEAQREIEGHLDHYGPIKEVIGAKLSVSTIEMLKEDLEKNKQRLVWRGLSGVIEILGYGISRLDERVYRAW